MSDANRAAADEQYSTLRAGRGFVELNGWPSISVTGADRHAFLHNFCTNDVKRLQPGDSCEAFFTNVKGKILAYGVISCRDQELVIVTTPGQAEKLIPHLDRYIIREDVTLADTTHERAFVLTTGPHDVPGVVDIRWGLLGPIECRLLEVSRESLPQVLSALRGQGLIEADQKTFDTLRIEIGTPLFGDFDESNLPQEVGRDQQAISFTKGCYLGQETVARIDALGHVNQQIAGVRFVGGQTTPAGTELLHDGQVVGVVTSATWSPLLQAPLALAMVRRPHVALQSRLESNYGVCEVIKLPLNDPA